VTPLEIFEARWAAAGISAPYWQTVNYQVDLDSMPSIWASATYYSPERPDMTMGSEPFVQENGTVLVALFASAGSGSSALNPLVAEVRAAFAGYSVKDADGETLFVQVNGPEDLDPQTTGNWWQLLLTVPCEVYTRRVTP
jgi:hypothetical protein